MLISDLLSRTRVLITYLLLDGSFFLRLSVAGCCRAADLGVDLDRNREGIVDKSMDACIHA